MIHINQVVLFQPDLYFSSVDHIDSVFTPYHLILTPHWHPMFTSYRPRISPIWPCIDLVWPLFRFTKNLSADNIQVSTLKGEGQLQDLELDEMMLMQVLDLPTSLCIVSATCNKIFVRVSDRVVVLWRRFCRGWCLDFYFSLGRCLDGLLLVRVA